MFGFINWKLIFFLQFDHIYTCFWFLFLLFIFAASLVSCTLSVQLPVLRSLRRWKFYKNVQTITENQKNLPLDATNLLMYKFHSANYTLFRQNKMIYAYSGLLGRFGPIVVHASLILLLFGVTIGNLGGYLSQEIVPRGEIFHIQNFTKTGAVSQFDQKFSWRVNDFWITYVKNTNVGQFYSDLSLLDNYGNELDRKTIFVNEPLLYNGITLYQTDWDITGVKFQINEDEQQQLLFKKVKKEGKNFWFGFIKNELVTSLDDSFSILCPDLSGKIFLYNNQGNLIKVVKLGQSFRLTNNTTIKFSEFLTSTGLQIKTDPGLKTIYSSFLLLIISTFVSFLSYSQIWGVETGPRLILTGISNRSILLFQMQFRRLVKLDNLLNVDR